MKPIEVIISGGIYVIVDTGATFSNGQAVYVAAPDGLKEWDSYSSNGTYNIEPLGTTGTIKSKPVFIDGYERYEVAYADGTTGWSAGTYLGWDQDIGSPTPAGSASYNAGTGVWTVSGGGTGFAGDSDQFNFDAQSVSGDASVTAQVSSQTATQSGSSAGLMFRTDDTAGAAYAAVSLTGDGNIDFQWRSSAGTNASQTLVSGLAAPVYLKLNRIGQSFTAYYSSDGATWVQVAPAVSVQMPTLALAGMAVTGDVNGVANAATFANYAIASPVLPPGWSDNDIGSASQPGTASYDGQTLTITSSGALAPNQVSYTYVGGKSDAYNTVDQPLGSNQQIVTEVTGEQDVDPWTKAGVMLRAGSDAGAAFVGLFVTPGWGVVMIDRPTEGANATTTGFDNSYGLANGPLWLKLTDQNGEITGYVSTDNTNWSQIGQVSVSLGGAALAGLAASGGDGQETAVSTFENFSLGAISAMNLIPEEPYDVQSQDFSGADGRVMWEPMSGITSFAIQQSTDGGVTFQTVASVPGSADTFVPTDLSPDTTYTYRIQASNSLGLSLYSSSINMTTGAATPEGYYSLWNSPVRTLKPHYNDTTTISVAGTATLADDWELAFLLNASGSGTNQSLGLSSTLGNFAPAASGSGYYGDSFGFVIKPDPEVGYNDTDGTPNSPQCQDDQDSTLYWTSLSANEVYQGQTTTLIGQVVDTNTQVSEITFEIDWGDGSDEEQITSPLNSGTADFTDTYTYSEYSESGPDVDHEDSYNAYPITVTASDGYTSAVDSCYATVDDIQLTDLSVADDAHPSNQVVVPQGGNNTLYVAETNQQNAVVDIAADWYPDASFGDVSSSQYVLWHVDGNSASSTDGSFEDGNPAQVVLTPADNGSHEFTISAGIDTDGTFILYPDEVEATVVVDVVQLQTLTVSDANNSDNYVESAGTGGTYGSGTIPTLYVEANPLTSDATISLDASILPQDYGASGHVLYDVSTADGQTDVASGPFGGPSPNVELMPSRDGDPNYVVNAGVDADNDNSLESTEITHTVDVNVWSLNAQGTVELAYEGNDQEFTLGSISLSNNVDPQATYDAVIDWGDNYMDTVALGGGSQVLTITDDHEYDEAGPYVPVVEVLQTDDYAKDDSPIPVGFVASYIDVTTGVDDAELERDAGHSVPQGVLATFPVAQNFNPNSGTFSLSASDGTAPFSFEQSLDIAGEGSQGANINETNGNIAMQISADGQFDYSPDDVEIDDLDVSDYSVYSDATSNLTVTENHQDLGLSHTTTLTAPDIVINSKTYYDEGEYSWSLVDSANYNVQDTGVSGSDPTDHSADDALVHEDPAELAWVIGMQGLTGSYTASGTENWSNNQTETGEYFDDSFNQTQIISSNSTITQTSTNGDQNYTQTFSPSEHATITSSEDGDSDEYLVNSTDTVSAGLNRYVTDQQSTITLTGTINTDATIADTINDDSGDFNLSTNGDDEFKYNTSETQQGQNATELITGTSDNSETYSDSNNGNVLSGTFSLSNGTLSDNSTASSTATDQTDTQTSTIISNPTATMTESGQFYGGEVTADATTTLNTTTTGTDTNSPQTINSTVTVTGNSTLDTQENLGSGVYTVNTTLNTTANNNIVTTNAPMTVTDMSTISTSATSNGDTGNDDLGNYTDSASTATIITNNNIVTVNGPLSSTDLSTITVTSNSGGDSGNDISGNYTDSLSTVVTNTTDNILTTDGPQTISNTSTSNSTLTAGSETGDDDEDGTYTDSTSSLTSTTNNNIVTTNGPQTTTDLSTIDSTVTSNGDSGDDIDGTYSDSGSTATTTTYNNIVTTNDPETITDLSTITTTVTNSSGSSGDDIDGTYTDTNSTATTTTNNNIVTTDGPQTITDLSTIDSTVTSDGDNGNDIDGTYTDSDSTATSTTNNNIVTINGPETITDTSSIDSTVTSDGDNGNDINGTYTDSASNSTSTTYSNIVTTNDPETITDLSTITTTVTSSSGSGGNDISGTYTDTNSTATTTTNNNIVTTDGPQTITDLSTIDSTVTSDGDNGNDIDGTYTDSDSTATSTTNNNIVTINGPETITDTSSIDSTVTSDGDNGNDINGTYTDSASNSTSTSYDNIVTTNDPETITNLSTITTTATSDSGSSGDDVNGTYTDSDSNSTTTTNNNIVTTDGSETITDTSNITTTSTSDGDSGNDVAGNYTDNASTVTSQTNNNILTADGPQTTTDTSTITSTITTTGDSGNDYTGTYTDNSSNSTSTTYDDIVTTDSPQTITNTSTITMTATSGSETGNDINGTYTDSSGNSTTTTYNNIVTTDASETITDTSNITTTSTTGTDSGNDLSGTYNDSPSTVTTTTDNDIVTVDGPQTTTDTSTITTTVTGGTSSGNDISGNYTDSPSTTVTSDDVDIVVTTGLMTAVTTGTDTTTVTASDSGNSITGDYTGTSSETNSSDVTTTDTYSDGTDTQVVTSSGSSNSFTTSNSISGDYTTTSGASSTNTTQESGTRSGDSYSLSDTSTVSTGSNQSGNSISGDYTLSTNSTDGDSSTRTGAGYVLTQTASQTGSAYTTGDSLSGDYSTSATGSETLTQQETADASGEDSTLSQTETTTDAIGETGNSLTGTFSSIDDQTVNITLSQSGYDVSGSFSLNESSSDTPTVTTTGNSIDGTQTMVTTGSQSYTVSQTNTDGSDNYTLSETGTKDYTQTENDNAENGVSSIGETGTDSYTMVQNGTSSGSVYTVTVSGTDTYTIADDENAQTGSFDSVTSGTDDYTTYSNPLFLSGQNPFSSTEVGNSFAGTMSLTQSGTNRYDLLTDFNNSSDGANGGTGMADFSPVGLPILIQRQSVPAGTFDKLGDVAHKYCFAKGTQVLLADGSYQAIEKIETGTMVLAAPEDNPEAAPTACRVLEVYHNPPARIWEVKIQGEVIRTTAGHPFYVKERGWTKVQDLKANDRLRTHEGKWIAIQAVRESGHSEPVFNLCVDDNHTYLVRLGELPAAVVVHNDSNDGNNSTPTGLVCVTGTLTTPPPGTEAPTINWGSRWPNGVPQIVSDNLIDPSEPPDADNESNPVETVTSALENTEKGSDVVAGALESISNHTKNEFWSGLASGLKNVNKALGVLNVANKVATAPDGQGGQVLAEGVTDTLASGVTETGVSGIVEGIGTIAGFETGPFAPVIGALAGVAAGYTAEGYEGAVNAFIGNFCEGVVEAQRQEASQNGSSDAPITPEPADKLNDYYGPYSFPDDTQMWLDGG